MPIAVFVAGVIRYVTYVDLARSRASNGESFRIVRRVSILSRTRLRVHAPSSTIIIAGRYRLSIVDYRENRELRSFTC